MQYEERKLSLVLIHNFVPNELSMKNDSSITLNLKRFINEVKRDGLAKLVVMQVEFGPMTKNGSYARLGVKVAGQVGVSDIVNVSCSSYSATTKSEPKRCHLLLPPSDAPPSSLSVIHRADEVDNDRFVATGPYKDVPVEKYNAPEGGMWPVKNNFHVSKESPFVEYLVFCKFKKVIREFLAAKQKMNQEVPMEEFKVMKTKAYEKIRDTMGNDFQISEGQYVMPVDFVETNLETLKKHMSSVATVGSILENLRLTFIRINPSVKGEWSPDHDAELSRVAEHEKTSMDFYHEQEYTLSVEILLTVRYPVNKTL